MPTVLKSDNILGVAAAFCPGSTRVVLALSDTVNILETNAGGGWGYVVSLRCGAFGPHQWSQLGFKLETRCVAFSPDGNLVLTVQSSRSRTVTSTSTHEMKIWDAYTGAELLSLEGHEKRVSEACFSPCGKYIASASRDHMVRLWRTRDGTCITTLSGHHSEVLYVVFSPDGKTLISAADDGSVIIRQMCHVLPMDEWDP